MKTLHRRRTVLVRTLSAATAVTTALTLAACSDDSGSGDSSDSAAADHSTVSVSHAYGTTDVPTPPEPARSFSRTWTDASAAPGEPVATQIVNDQFADGVPWTPEGTTIAEETVPVTVSSADLVTTLGLEAVADKKPDVIFAGYLPDKDTYDKLAAIAPTVATVGGGMVDDWQTVTTTAGKILDKQNEAADAVTDVKDTMAGVAKKYPAVKGASFAYAAYRAKSFTVIPSPQDASNAFFTDLGMVSAADRIKGTESGRGRAVSAENLDMLDVDFLPLWVAAEKPDDLPGWSALRPVRRGTAPELDTVTSTALGAPSVLSIPWVIDQLDPAFAAL
jgi:iron complex transport system substrate-binding protein